ncbi:MAG: phosphate ABC transporter permease PstA [Myxococcales bacterium]|nr:phosphate ABC transporter permease PstA [Myxococcales bacterium]
MKSARNVAFGALAGSALLLLLLALALVLGSVVVAGIPALARGSTDGLAAATVGTALVTAIMTLLGVPFAVITAVYLAEYAPECSTTTRWVRAAVRALAGVPSIVFGLFGLGFFVLFVGRGMDRILYPGLGAVFGRPCVLWSGATLAVLTLPVVIVTTEEALRRVPRELREAALALGATKLETTFVVVLPAARVGVLTGVVLAIGRGAGEVAPILFTGAANFVPDLPTDVRAMFMHLGFHLYALSTQAADVSRSRPAAQATALLLLLVTLALNGTAIALRHRASRE